MTKNELCTQLENYDMIHDHIEYLLNLTKADETIRNETLLVFEALYHDMTARGIPKDTQVSLQKAGHFGSVNIRICFEGNLYVPLSGDENDVSVEQKIMSAFGDRIEHRYNDGSTILTLVVTRSAHIAARDIGITMALAILALAIYSEAVFGFLLSATNAAGAIVTVAIAEKQEKASRK